MESEKATEKYLVNQMKSIGGLCFKFVSPMVRGVPDRICIFPFGRIVFIEVKSESVDPKNHQIRIHKHMRKVGATVLVVDTKAQVDELIKKYKGGDMSSLADRQAVTIISVAHGAIRLLIKEKRFSQVHVQQELESLYVFMDEVRNSWSSSHGNRDIIWTLNSIDSWNTDLTELGYEEAISTPILVKISVMALTDLLEKLRNKKRIDNVTLINKRLNTIDNMVDPTGVAFISLSEADKILASLYKRIGFSN